MYEVAYLAGTLVFALALVYFFIQRQGATYGRHVQQLQPKKKPKEFKIYTREEVALHASRNDAWVMIKDKRTAEQRVYDLTDYVDEHPGGESILNNIGGDSTEGFHGPQHPDTVFLMLDDFCIGRLQD